MATVTGIRIMNFSKICNAYIVIFINVYFKCGILLQTNSHSELISVNKSAEMGTQERSNRKKNYTYIYIYIYIYTHNVIIYI